MLGPKALERVIKPSVAEMQYEYFEAHQSGRPMLARWVRIKYVPIWAWTLFAFAVAALCKTVSDARKILD